MVDICIMQKRFFLVFFLGATLCTDAQTFKAKILAGVATSQVSGDQLAGFNKAGIMAGAGVSTKLSEKADLGFEMYYIQKGSVKQSNIDKGDLVYYRLRLNYVEVPILFEYHLSEKFRSDGLGMRDCVRHWPARAVRRRGRGVVVHLGLLHLQ